jgi:hypothetical protein
MSVTVAVILLLVVVAIGTWTRKARRSRPVWDCGQEGCPYRGRANHRHHVPN